MTVDDYLADVSGDFRPLLEKLRQIIKTTAPQAEEVISYGIPLYKYKGHLVAFAAFKNHCGFYVVSSSILKIFKGELEKYEKAKTTVRFTPDNPLPDSLVERIVKTRIEQNEAAK